MPPQRRSQGSPFNPWKWLSMTMIASFVTYTLYSQLRKATGPLDLGIKTDGLLSGEDGSFRDRVASVVARLKEAASMEVEAHTSWAGESPTAAPATTNSEKEADRMKPNDAPETTDNTAKSVPKASPKVAEEGKGKDEEKAKSGPNNKGEAPKKAPKKEPTKKEPKKAPAPKEAPKKDASKAAPKEAASKQSSKKEDKGTKKASITTSSSKHSKVPAAMTSKPVLQPVKGPIATNGSKPLWNMQHKGTDAIMALACKYPVQFYKRFVGSLRKAGFSEDIVLAVSPVNQMKPGVEAYLKEQQVVSYAFEVDCAGPDNCKLRDEFLGYPDPREHRTFANIRYALYEYWLQYYELRSYVLILDFRDTFFQTDPMGEHLPFLQRTPKYDLRVFAENYKVKNIEKCVFNSMWVRKCFGPEAFDSIKHLAVICSGSTYGSYLGITHYVQTMLNSMDTVQCWKKGIESDQGYQSYLFYTGAFNTPLGNATKFDQGEGVVNTIGAMNGFRVPKEMKGPLDTFWKIRDSEGFVLNNDGKRSSCVHQWDRFYDELQGFIDRKLLDPNTKLV